MFIELATRTPSSRSPSISTSPTRIGRSGGQRPQLRQNERLQVHHEADVDLRRDRIHYPRPAILHPNGAIAIIHPADVPRNDEPSGAPASFPTTLGIPKNSLSKT
jgi:hypothetical protein